MLAQERKGLRHLHGDLQSRSDDRAPRNRDGEPVLRTARAVVEERRDHRNVPRDGRRVRDEKFVMTVEDAEEPRRHHEQARAGKQDAHDLNRQVALVALEAGRDHVDEIRRHQHADRDQHRHANGHDRADAPCEHVGGFGVALAEQFAVNRNERRRQHALAEQVLQDVRDAEAGFERVGRGRVAEKMREDAVAHEAGNPAEQYADGDGAGVVRAGAARAGDSGAWLDARFVAVLFGCDFGQGTSDAKSIPTASGA